MKHRNPISSSRNPNRRQFLKGAAVTALAAPTIIPSSAWSKSPNDRINLGFIGMGKMGRGHLGGFLKKEETQIVAISEVADVRLDDAIQRVHAGYAKQMRSGNYTGCDGHKDFRDLLKRRDIDAVVISTPDHWHAIPAIMACKAGKDVYCEKPLSLTIEEGRAMVRAVRRYKRVFQTGSQQRTQYDGNFRKACEFVRSGRIGDVKTVRVGVGAPPKPCDLPEEALPAGIDWEMWQGPVPARGYSSVLCPADVHNHFPHFRDYREYAGGRLADMGAHHFDIAQWGLDMDRSVPRFIVPPEKGDTGLRFVYANGVEMFHGGPSGTTFEGTKGTIYVDRRSFKSTPEKIIQEPLRDDEVHLYNSGTDHKGDWLNCIRTRKQPVADVEVGARTAAICQLANIGYELRRTLEWDPRKERFIDAAGANDHLSRRLAAPWKLG